MKDINYIYSIQKEICLLSEIAALLSWDEETQLPEQAISERAEQEVIIEQLIHKKMRDNKLYFSIKNAEKQKLKLKDKIVIREFKKDVEKIRKIPKELAEELTRTTTASTFAWKKAREKNDFKIFEPYLKKIVNLLQKKAKCLNPNVDLYDALLNEYEEGMTADKLTKAFSELKPELVKLLNKIKSSPKYKNQKKRNIKISKENQDKIVREIIKQMGLQKDSSYFTTSTHPFTIRISKNDVRFTTRYNNAFESLLAAIHESGHALYELGMPKEYEYTVVRDAPSIGLHESQSRFWENMIGRNKRFWIKYYNSYKKFIDPKPKFNDFFHMLNQVKPSYIRVEADEITYCLHIILRFEIERDLINNKLSVADASKEWNKKFKQLFGIDVKKDSQGILQDIHWSMGSFGYFPTYAIGSIYAVQLFNQIKKEIKNLDLLIEKHDFKKILEWLRKNIHSKGRTKVAEEIIKESCGQKLNIKEYIDYLNKKYSEIYNI